MKQGDLFDGITPIDPKHLARKDHPDTSHQAAAEIAHKLTALHHEVADCVKQKPGMTRRELDAHFKSHDPCRIGRRLPECERAGLVHREHKRECGESGKVAYTWWPGPKPSQPEEACE